MEIITVIIIVLSMGQALGLYTHSLIYRNPMKSIFQVTSFPHLLLVDVQAALRKDLRAIDLLCFL